MNIETDGPMHPKGGKTGLLLVNLGTPDAPDKKAVKRYLKEFLSDKRVVEIPDIIWQPILRGIILNTRPKKSAHAYNLVWTDEGSPLAVYTKRQAEALAVLYGDEVHVDWAMRYGNPSIASRLQAMKDAGCDRILIAPLYPQYSGATTASVHDAVFDAIKAMRWQPAIRMLPPYYDDAAYIDALKSSVEAALGALDYEPDAVIASFHGMPKRTVELGDPYQYQCERTAQLLSQALGRELVITFQSRFGPAKWLEPATDMMLEKLAQQGKKKIAIFAPGFSSDCLETCEELGIRGKETFEAAGGERFALIPCLNDSAIGMDMLGKLMRRELSGWI